MATLRAPVSKASREASLITSGTATAALSKTWLDMITVTPSTTMTLNAHQHTTAVGEFDGQVPNVLYAVTPGIKTSVTYKKFTLTGSFNYVYQETYKGNVRHKYANTLSLSYQPTSMVAVAVGLSNAGNTTRNRGLNNNITLFKADSTQFFGKTRITF